MPETEVITQPVLNPADPAAVENLIDRLGKSPALTKFTEQRKLLLAVESHLAIDTDEQLQAANALLNSVKEIIGGITKFWKAPADLYFKIHRAITGARAADLKTWEESAAKLERAMKQFVREQQEAKKKAEAQLAREAEKQRKLLEAQATQEIAAGNVAAGLQLQTVAKQVQAPILPGAVPQLDGTAYAPKYVATVTDLKLLILSVAFGIAKENPELVKQVKKVPLDHMYRGESRPLLTVDNAVLQSQAGTHGMTLKWPGVKVEEDINFKRKAR